MMKKFKIIIIIIGGLGILLFLLFFLTKNVNSVINNQNKTSALSTIDYMSSFRIENGEPLDPNEFVLKGVKPGDVFTKTIRSNIGKLVKNNRETSEDGHLFNSYLYSGFTIGTIVLNDEGKTEKINGFKIIGSNIKTCRDLTIGDDLNKVIEKYGENKLENNSIVYETESYVIIFKLDTNRKVKEIELLGPFM